MTLDELIETLDDLRIDNPGTTKVKLVRTKPDGTTEMIDLEMDQIEGEYQETLVFNPNLD